MYILEPVCPNKCSYIHDTSCTYEFFRKLGTVCNIGVKYYVFFHFLPLVLRVKKGKTRQDKIKAVLRTLYEYVKSILFMGSLVSLTKGALCIKNSLSIPFHGYSYFIQAILVLLNLSLQAAAFFGSKDLDNDKSDISSWLKLYGQFM